MKVLLPNPLNPVASQPPLTSCSRHLVKFHGSSGRVRTLSVQLRTQKSQPESQQPLNSASKPLSSAVAKPPSYTLNFQDMAESLIALGLSL